MKEKDPQLFWLAGPRWRHHRPQVARLGGRGEQGGGGRYGPRHLGACEALTEVAAGSKAQAHMRVREWECSACGVRSYLQKHHVVHAPSRDH